MYKKYHGQELFFIVAVIVVLTHLDADVLLGRNVLLLRAGRRMWRDSVGWHARGMAAQGTKDRVNDVQRECVKHGPHQNKDVGDADGDDGLDDPALDDDGQQEERHRRRGQLLQQRERLLLVGRRVQVVLDNLHGLVAETAVIVAATAALS